MYPNSNTTPEQAPNLCACGCGNSLPVNKSHSKNRRFIRGHDKKGNKYFQGRCHSAQARSLIARAHIGTKLPEMVKDKIGIAHKTLWSDPQYRAKMCNSPEGLWDKVDKQGECWPYQGYCPNGYGIYSAGGKQWQAHRLAWILTYGSIPDGLHVLHTCDNPPCCNPEHLFLGTNLDNIADRTAKGRWRVKSINHPPRD